MDLTAEAIKKIQELTEGQDIIVHEDGQAYSRFNLKPVFNDPRPSSLGMSTLDGISDYIDKNLDDVNAENCIIVIDTYDHITVYSPVEGDENDRHKIAVSSCNGVDIFNFGEYLEQEDFIISFSSLFCETPDKEKILAAVATMQILDEVSGDDNGLTTARKASNNVLCGVDEAEMPKTVVTLKPFRTFREVDQPESAFIFRYRKGRHGLPEIALFEADGGAWKLEAKSRIKAYLSEGTEAPIIC